MFNALFDRLGNLLVADQGYASSLQSVVLRVPDTFKLIKGQAITAGTPISIWTPAAGKRFRLMGYALVAGAATFLLFEDTTGSGNEFMRAPVGASPSVSGPLGNGYLSSAVNNQLFVDAGGSTTINGMVWGVEE